MVSQFWTYSPQEFLKLPLYSRDSPAGQAVKVGFFWPYTPEHTTRMVRLGEDLGFDLVGIADTPGNAMDLWVAMTGRRGEPAR